ncbi:MAG TPA: tRNA glutamyl-Q(34) synthetase GluQRS [Beijerinckiaceae bacterium]|nr:tRNA glutamyl-Q(34) synthetase GluQRS [Beijerinckiaceae bacterium]
MQPVFRFAPSPNGYLHLGHAYSALVNQRHARETDGRLLLRIEDIDVVRCRPELVEACLEDLHWLGLTWEEPVLRQSTHFPRYRAVLETLKERRLLYPCFCSRKDIVAHVATEEARTGAAWPRDPDGTPRYPGTCRSRPAAEIAKKVAAGEAFALRLDMGAALSASGMRGLSWREVGAGRVVADPALWGDVVLGRKETPTSYHLAVVLDDALQGVTDVVRGMDLYAATAVHRVLQTLLGLPEPRYRHHTLIRDPTGQKLAKSRASTPLRQLRAEGWSAADVRRALGVD